MFYILETNFTSVQNSSGHTSFKTFDVRRAGHVNVTVTTCDISMLKLVASNEEMAFITVLVRVPFESKLRFTITFRRELIKHVSIANKNNCNGDVIACL